MSKENQSNHFKVNLLDMESTYSENKNECNIKISTKLCHLANLFLMKAIPYIPMFVNDFTWKMNITNPLHNIGISFFIFSTNTLDKQQGKFLQ